MNIDHYFIKSGYQINSHNFTLDSNVSTFWTEKRIWASHYYQYHVYTLASRIVKERRVKSVLDVGCGPATKLMRVVFPHCSNVVGIDQFSAIEICKKRYKKGEFYVDNFETPKLRLNKKFDLIICCDVIEHLLDPDVLLYYIKRFCYKDSLIIFSTPERDLLRGVDCMASKKPEHVREWNQLEFLNYLESRGFEIRQTKLVPPMKFNLSKEYRLLLKRVLKGIHAFNTCQIAVIRLSKGV